MTKWLATLATLGCLAHATTAAAQSYPNRSITIVVTSAAGGLTDVLTRAVALRLSQIWNQSVVIENRGGAGHNLAAVAVMKAPADGYTLLATETGMFTTQPHLYTKGKLLYDADNDFVPVAGYAGIPMGLLVNPSVPVNNVNELVALAKAKPGAVSFGTAGPGTALHTGALLLQSMTGIDLTAVHYRGASPALNDVIAGHINMVIMGPSIALPAVRDGKLKMLGFGSLKRVPQLPNIPTIAESIPGFEASVAFGLFAPKATPRAIINKVNADVQQVLNDPPFRQKILEPQVVEQLPGPPDAFADYLRKQSAKWAKVIADAKLKIE
jgi:tripartite-type tricarboxylate transporter receptor subunit TctC